MISSLMSSTFFQIFATFFYLPIQYEYEKVHRHNIHWELFFSLAATLDKKNIYKFSRHFTESFWEKYFFLSNVNKHIFHEKYETTTQIIRAGLLKNFEIFVLIIWRRITTTKYPTTKTPSFIEINFCWCSFTHIYDSLDRKGKRKDISLTFSYHFHLLHRRLEVIQRINSERSPMQAETRNILVQSTNR